MSSKPKSLKSQLLIMPHCSTWTISLKLGVPGKTIDISDDLLQNLTEIRFCLATEFAICVSNEYLFIGILLFIATVITGLTGQCTLVKQL